jgi:hypothetical protein
MVCPQVAVGGDGLQIWWRKGDALSPLFFNFPLEYANRKVQKPG